MHCLSPPPAGRAPAKVSRVGAGPYRTVRYVPRAAVEAAAGDSLGCMSAAPHDNDGPRYVPRPVTPGVGDPAALAIAALVLGTLSLGGFGLMNGSTYVLPFTQGESDTTRTVLAGLLGAALALGAVVLGLVSSKRAHPGDPAWVPRAAQAGVLVAGVAVVLRLVATSAAAVQVAESGFFAPL
jgi:hypothetical protein